MTVYIHIARIPGTTYPYADLRQKQSSAYTSTLDAGHPASNFQRSDVPATSHSPIDQLADKNISQPARRPTDISSALKQTFKVDRKHGDRSQQEMAHMQKSSPSKTPRPSSTTNVQAPVSMKPIGGTSWHGSRPDPDNTPTSHRGIPVLKFVPSRAMATTSTKPKAPLKISPSPTAISSPKPHPQPSGFKIRVPRDLANIPDVFRKPDSARSQSSASPGSTGSSNHSPTSSPNPRTTPVHSEPLYQQRSTLPSTPTDTSKRTHGDMLSGENTPTKNYPIFDQQPYSGKKIKIEPASSISKPIVPRASRSLSRSNSSQSLSSGVPPSPKRSPTKRNSMKHIMPALLPQLPSQLPPVKLTFAANSAGPVVQDVVVKREDMDVSLTPVPLVRRHRSRSQTKSSSPACSPTPASARLPSPMPSNSGINTGSTEPNRISSSLPPTSNDTTSSPLPVQPIVNVAQPISYTSKHPVVDATSSSSSSTSASGNGSSTPSASNNQGSSPPTQVQNNGPSDDSQNSVHVTGSSPPPAESIAKSIGENIRTNETLQLVRLGMSILDRLLSNPVSKSFVNKVPLALANYHSVIKLPMDLTTIEQTLWKAFVVQQQSVSQPMYPDLLSTADHITYTNGYSKQTEFEHDLRQIYKNAVQYNPPSDNIHKQATSFQILYNGLLMANRDGLLPIPRMPQELYHPSLVNLSDLGPLYLFRAQNFREMDRKLTDTAVDLFVNFHQPLIDVMNSPEPISPERPRFARMYINKSRSQLSNCRDDPRARMAILSDLKVSKPFNDPSGGPNPAKLVKIKARVMIGKPIGERHDMITVGDLDCPSAWIIFAGVKTLDLDADVPSRFEKRVVSRIRHDVTPFVDGMMTPQQARSFLTALNLTARTIVKDKPELSQDARSSVQLLEHSAQSTARSVQPPFVSIQTPAPVLEQAVPPMTTTNNLAIENIAAKEPLSLPSSTLPSSAPPTLASVSTPTLALDPSPAPAANLTQLAEIPSDSTVALQRLGSQELKRPFEETIPRDQSGTVEAQHLTKRRHSLVSNDLDLPIAVNTQADHAIAPSHIPTELKQPVPAHSPAPAQRTPVAPPTEVRPSILLPSAATDGQPDKGKFASPPGSESKESSSTARLAPVSNSTATPIPMSTPGATTITSAPAPSSFTGQGDEFGLDKMLPTSSELMRKLTAREEQMLRDIKATAQEKHVPYTSWSAIEPTLIAVNAQGLFKRIYHVKGVEGLVVQNFKEMDPESFEQRVREVACLLKLRGLEGVGQIQSIIDDNEDHLVGLSMTKYAYTLKAYATNARRHPSPCQKLSLIRDMVSALSSIHGAGLAHRDLSEVNIMIDEDPFLKLEDNTPRPWVRVIDFGKSVFVEPEEVKRWSMQEKVSDEELALLPLVVLPPDHGYKLYRSILTLPRSKHDHTLLPPCDPRAEDVYSLGVLIWRTFSGKSPWNGAIEDDIKTIRYLISSDEQIKFQLEREVTGQRSRELLLRCMTAEASTRSTIHELREWLEQPDILAELLKEFEILGGGRKKVRKNLD
ncbi:hypothetical protein EC991_006603 [Linnemannia zychae]|nr:hypothetical protein EC991_006603 [Linnemannia zychae]